MTQSCAYCGKPDADKPVVMLVKRAREAGVKFKLPTGVYLHGACEVEVRKAMGVAPAKPKAVKKSVDDILDDHKIIARAAKQAGEEGTRRMKEQIAEKTARHVEAAEQGAKRFAEKVRAAYPPDDLLSTGERADDDLLAVEKEQVKVNRDTMIPVGSRVVVVYDWPHVTYYKSGDTGVVRRSWTARRESEGCGYDASLYEVEWDKPRERSKPVTILYGYEVKEASPPPKAKPAAKPVARKSTMPTHDELVKWGVEKDGLLE